MISPTKHRTPALASHAADERPAAIRAPRRAYRRYIGRYATPSGDANMADTPAEISRHTAPIFRPGQRRSARASRKLRFHATPAMTAHDRPYFPFSTRHFTFAGAATARMMAGADAAHSKTQRRATRPQFRAYRKPACRKYRHGAISRRMALFHSGGRRLTAGRRRAIVIPACFELAAAGTPYHARYMIGTRPLSLALRYITQSISRALILTKRLPYARPAATHDYIENSPFCRSYHFSRDGDKLKTYWFLLDGVGGAAIIEAARRRSYRHHRPLTVMADVGDFVRSTPSPLHLVASQPLFRHRFADAPASYFSGITAPITRASPRHHAYLRRAWGFISRPRGPHTSYSRPMISRGLRMAYDTGSIGHIRFFCYHASYTPHADCRWFRHFERLRCHAPIARDRRHAIDAHAASHRVERQRRWRFRATILISSH